MEHLDRLSDLQSADDSTDIRLDPFTLLAYCTTHVQSDPESVVSTFLQWLQTKTGATTLFFHVWDPDVGELLPLRIKTEGQLSPQLRRLIRCIVQMGVRVQDIQVITDPADLNSATQSSGQVENIVLIPLTSTDQLLGALGFIDVPLPISSEDVELSRSLASALLIIILQHQQLQDVTRQHSDVTALNDRLQDTLRELERRQEMIEALEIEYAGDAIITIDPSGKIISWNKGAERIYGYTKTETLGQNLDLLKSSQNASDEQCFIDRALAGAVSSGIEVIRQTKSGQDMMVSLTISPIVGLNGKTVGICSIERDITQQKQLEEAIRLQNESLEQIVQMRTAELQVEKRRAEAASIAKSEFLANMSHELRTPLHGIISFATLGIERLGTAKPERLNNYFTKIYRSSEVLLSLLNDLLDLAKIESGKMDFDFQLDDVQARVAMIIDDFQSLLSERSLSLQYKVTTEQIVAYVDAQRFMQVVRNLLSNAVKFSPPEGTIQLEIVQCDSTLRLSVSDQGPGIPPDEVETIFDKFVQSSATQTGAGGTGLGLSICREIVAAHHGSIWVASRTEGGAVFTLEIPISVSIRGVRTDSNGKQYVPRDEAL